MGQRYCVAELRQYNTALDKCSVCNFVVLPTKEKAKQYIKTRYTEEFVIAGRYNAIVLEDYTNFLENQEKDTFCYARLQFQEIGDFVGYVPSVILWDMHHTERKESIMDVIVNDALDENGDKEFDVVKWYASHPVRIEDSESYRFHYNNIKVTDNG